MNGTPTPEPEAAPPETVDALLDAVRSAISGVFSEVFDSIDEGSGTDRLGMMLFVKTWKADVPQTPRVYALGTLDDELIGAAQRTLNKIMHDISVQNTPMSLEQIESVRRLLNDVENS